MSSRYGRKPSVDNGVFSMHTYKHVKNSMMGESDDYTNGKRYEEEVEQAPLNPFFGRNVKDIFR
jgi:hypothetical protein